VLLACITFPKILERALVSATRYFYVEHYFRNEVLLRLSLHNAEIYVSNEDKNVYSQAGTQF